VVGGEAGFRGLGQVWEPQPAGPAGPAHQSEPRPAGLQPVDRFCDLGRGAAVQGKPLGPGTLPHLGCCRPCPAACLLRPLVGRLLLRPALPGGRASFRRAFCRRPVAADPSFPRRPRFFHCHSRILGLGAVRRCFLLHLAVGQPACQRRCSPGASVGLAGFADPQKLAGGQDLSGPVLRLGRLSQRSATAAIGFRAYTLMMSPRFTGT
jgi:hypothetical protein